MIRKLMNHLTIRNAAMVSGVILALGLSGPIQAQEVVRFGSVGGLTDAGVYLADELGYFEEVGIEVEMKRMSNAPTLITSIATD